jgi:hypothetical protein
MSKPHATIGGTATLARPQPQESVSDPRRVLVRGLATVGLAGIALVHLVELPDTWRQTPGLGALFTILVVASAAVAVALLLNDTRLAWLAAALVALGPIAGYLLTRSASVAFDHEDVGNWLDPAVLAALFIEVSVLGLCAYALRHTVARQVR